MSSEAFSLVWKALADPSRRQILDLLREQPRTTGELNEHFEFSRYAVMKHLSVLEKAQLIIIKRVGRNRWNHLNAVPIRHIYERWVSEYEAHWASSMLHLKQVAEIGKGDREFMDGIAELNEVVIEQEVKINAGIAQVFNALTREISKWWRAPFFHGESAQRMVLEPSVGGRFYEDWGDGEGLLLCTVTSIKRPTALQMSGPMGMPGAIYGDISFLLAESDAGTVLRLSHHALGIIKEETKVNHAVGWQVLLGENLKLHIEG